MKIGISGYEVRLYPQDDQEQNIADKVARFQKRQFRYLNNARCLVYHVPPDKDALHGALTAILGSKRGAFMFERVMEKVGEPN